MHIAVKLLYACYVNAFSKAAGDVAEKGRSSYAQRECV